MPIEGGSFGTGDESGALSPKNKVKFLCSHGGKILPRPGDCHLKYVGGDTRVIAVSRNITSSELMQKVTALVDGDMVLKYQPLHEDLDALISVRSDEDLKHMFSECDRHEIRGALMLRAFLFPSRPVVLENQAAVFEPHLLEQRYIDAINGNIRTSSASRLSLSPIRVFSTSSACSSPKSNSPEGHSVETVAYQSSLNSGTCNGRVPIHRVRSYPNIDIPNNVQIHNSGFGSPNYQQYDHGFHHSPNHHHYLPPYGGCQSYRLPQDSQIGFGTGRQPSYSLGKAEFGRGYSCSYDDHSPSRQHRGGSPCSKVGYSDEYAHFRFERAHSLPRSPRHMILE